MDKNNKLEWIGSYGWDGYPEGVPDMMDLKNVNTVDEYKKTVIDWLESKDGYIAGKAAWSWPWDNSATTDHYYFFYEGNIWCGGLYIGEGIYTIKLKDFLDNRDEFGEGEDCEEQVEEKACKLSFKDDYDLPDMSKIKDVDLGKASGVMVFRS